MKKSEFVLTLYFLLLYGLLPAAAQQSTFAKVFYDLNGSVQAYAISKTPDNNYLIAGHKDGMPFAMKMDPQGNILWSKNYGSNTGNIYSIASTNDSHFMLAGNIGNSGGTQFDILLIKITPDGDTVWSKTIDMGFSDNALFIMQTGDNGFILTGFSSDTTAQQIKALVIKLDATGNFSWGRLFNSGDDYNYIYSAAETSDSGFLVAGTVGRSSYYSNLLLMKLNSTGSVSWSKKHALTGYLSSSGNDLKILPDGILCYFTNENSELALIKTDLSGNVLWSKAVGYEGSFPDDKPSAKIHQTSDGGYVFVNGSYQFSPMASIVKVDSTGDALWTRNLFILASDMLVAYDSAYIIAGNGPIMGVRMGITDNPQIGIIKLDEAGNSTNCVYSEISPNGPYSAAMTPITLTMATAGSISAFHPAVTAVTLAADSGCVAFEGGIEETLDANPLKVIPNPSNGVFRLELNGQARIELYSIKVYNTFGEMVFISANSLKPESDLNLSFLPCGVYEIRAVAGDRIFSQKLIIVH